MIYRPVTFVVVICLLGCANVRPGPPPVDVDLMARIIADLNLAQSVSSQAPVIVRDSIQAIYFERVLTDYHLTRAEFDSLMWIVRQEPEWIDSIYARAGEVVSRGMVE